MNSAVSHYVEYAAFTTRRQPDAHNSLSVEVKVFGGKYRVMLDCNAYVRQAVCMHS